ncbi:PREDICTED: zinc finger protein-like 1 [Nicrophorus vespilloides]|uniref:Zinc finger protein-like 1 homolog n=1 Tax=Nicrophorus vespilloides TaxID=110193 RepID=A0ABM1MYL3_NICVS|nr:PREDICTED: zinc finger protein-like 1 [Nicrophorus vespilloides]
MGLCKCPKRRVTNQFCFEHRVNVCEHCMVSNHAKCIIQSYLHWLQDSDYNPICELCSKELHSEDCIRLSCYHVFHWACLDKYSRQLPATTAPAGYRCPSCGTPLFPPSNMVSPVADVLREKLAGVNWARAGLGLPLLSEDREIKPILSNNANNHTAVSTQNAPPPYSVVHFEDQVINRDKTEVYQTARRVFQDIRENRGTTFDHDDDKYKRRPASEWIRRWWKNSMGHPQKHRSPFRRYFMLIFIIVMGILVLLVTMSRLGHHYTDNDASLDIMNEPNIHVQADTKL